MRENDKRIENMDSDNLITWIIDKMPSIQIDLDWKNDEGTFKDENFLIEIGDCVVTANIEITITGRTDKGDYHTPPDYEVISEEFELNGIEVINEFDEVVECSESDLDRLSKRIKTKININ